jgi:hypothetical protein
VGEGSLGQTRKLTTAEAARDRRLRDIYKMSLEEFEAKKVEQDNKCVLCGRPFSEFQPYQDHDHNCCAPGRKLQRKYCGKCNRSLLCFLCNKYAIGLMEKMNKSNSKYKIDFVKAVEYLKSWTEKIKAKGGYEPKTKAKRPSKKQKSVR